MTSMSRSSKRRSSRAPAPMTPRVSPEPMIGATIASLKPLNATCGGAVAAASAPCVITGLPVRIASAAAPVSAVNSNPTSSSGNPCTAAHLSMPRRSS
jgi:hypothetical protein